MESELKWSVPDFKVPHPPGVPLCCQGQLKQNMVKSAQSYPLLCDPVDCSLPGSSVHGTLQAGILEWGATPSSRGASRPRDWARVSCISCSAGGCFVAEPLEKSCHGSVKVRSHIIWSFKYLRKFQMIFPPKSRNWISVLLWYFSREDLKDLV